MTSKDLIKKLVKLHKKCNEDFNDGTMSYVEGHRLLNNRIKRLINKISKEGIEVEQSTVFQVGLGHNKFIELENKEQENEKTL